MDHEVVINQYGFHQLAEIPSQEELNDYYANKYYQTDSSLYQHNYSIEELFYINNKIHQKALIIDQFIQPKFCTPSLLDVGCGEGYTLAWFKKKGWNVLGIDYSNYGCMQHNSEILPYLEIGDIYEKLQSVIANQEKYDCIWLDNVLEHVLDPKNLLEQLLKISHKGSIMVIEVPNDFSLLQEKLLKESKINKSFWVVKPDHISYFNSKGLEKLAEASGWNVNHLLSDFPIDINLANPCANYVNQKELGKGAHMQRVFMENLMHEISPQLTNQLYQTLAQMGLGRQITAFLVHK